MYLTELYRFYERMTQDPQSGMPPEGMSAEAIHFALVIGEDGSLKGVHDLRDSKGKPLRRFVPAAVKRTSTKVLPNFLWDNTGYVLGVDGKGNPAFTARKYESFRTFHRQLCAASPDRHARALLAFFDRWTPEQFGSIGEREALLDSNVVFQLEGDTDFLHQQPSLYSLWQDSLAVQDACAQGQCLITGQQGPVLKVHPAIRNVPGAKVEAALISFNCDSFQSFGKEQSENAPVSPRAARGYTTALNYLLQKEHKQVVRLGEDSIVFWTDRACAEESLLGALFDGLDATEQTQDSALLHKVRSLLTAMACGRPVSEDDGIDTSVRFFVLGLAPNAARLGVRLWVTDTFGNLLQRFGRWYRDLAIERRYPGEEEHPALWQLLRDLAPLQKSENIPPLLGGQLLRSILLGRAWPQSMYTAALQRIHADKNVTYYRAALIKAHLCDTTAKGATMSLDKEEQNKGYRLGRLFAVLEKAQTDALGSVNTSLRERYIGAASTRPCLVFPQLLKTAQFHISKRAKQHPGYDIRFSRLVSEIMDGMTAFPPVLSLEDQGRFMLGYYHQNKALYPQKTADDAEN
ncbi:type I-C CRISPR-associated protein Cas8c/Csd1 [Desulfovibrio piger]